MTSLARATALAVALVCAGVLSAVPASAESRTFKVGNTFLRAVAVANTDGPLRVTARLNKGAKINVAGLAVEVDTLGGRKGAEFLVTWTSGSRAEMWVNVEPGGYEPLACDGFTSTRLGDKVSRRFVVPRRCLTFDDKTATRVRVRLEGNGAKKTPSGWACRFFRYPAKGFSRWVEQGAPSDLPTAVDASAAQRRGC